MQSDYPERFERDVGCSEAEWLGWMPRALGAHAWRREGSRITVDIPPGALDIAWEPLPERRIESLCIDRDRSPIGDRLLRYLDMKLKTVGAVAIAESLDLTGIR